MVRCTLPKPFYENNDLMMKCNDLNNKDRMMFQKIEKIQNDFVKCYLINRDFYINIFQFTVSGHCASDYCASDYWVSYYWASDYRHVPVVALM